MELANLDSRLVRSPAVGAGDLGDLSAGNKAASPDHSGLSCGIISSDKLDDENEEAPIGDSDGCSTDGLRWTGRGQDASLQQSRNQENFASNGTPFGNNARGWRN